MKAIEVNNLAFSYDRNKPLLDIAHLEIQEGEKIFLHGPSGAGKTTLLSLLTGILVAPQGSVKVLNNDLSQMNGLERDDFRAKNIGIIFQILNLIPYLSALENILLPLWIHSERRSRIEGTVEQEVAALSERLGIVDFMSQKAFTLSIGQQQRVAVARALIGRPSIIIADEPTSALDDDNQQGFMDLLIENTDEQKATVLFVSHNKNLATYFDRSLSLKDFNRRPPS